MLSQQEAFIKCRDLNKPNAYADGGLFPQKLPPQEADKTLVAFKKAHILKAYLCTPMAVFLKAHTGLNCGQDRSGERRKEHAEDRQQLLREDPTGCSHHEKYCDLTEQ